jgi:hypothetical protein
MRRQEIVQGISIQTEDGKDAGMSSTAAINAIGQVIPSRIGIVHNTINNFISRSFTPFIMHFCWAYMLSSTCKE